MSGGPDWRKYGADLAQGLAALWRRRGPDEPAILPPLHPDGWRVIPIFAVATLILFWIWAPLGWIAVIATLWCASLFRMPGRVAPARPVLAVSPIDGIVTEIGSAVPPVELALGAADLPCVSIALGPCDSRVVRAAAEGRLAKAVPGHAASRDEFIAVRIEGDAGGTVGIALLAHGFGRRVSIGPNPGAALRLGEPLGLILFAGRADVFLPAGTIAAVAAGQRMVGGETVLAEPAAAAAASEAAAIPPESE